VSDRSRRTRLPSSSTYLNQPAQLERRHFSQSSTHSRRQHHHDSRRRTPSPLPPPSLSQLMQHTSRHHHYASHQNEHNDKRHYHSPPPPIISRSSSHRDDSFHSNSNSSPASNKNRKYLDDDEHDRIAGEFTSICLKNLASNVSIDELHDVIVEEFKLYGKLSVRFSINKYGTSGKYYDERIAFVNFTNHFKAKSSKVFND
jgi:hypothetical protein